MLKKVYSPSYLFCFVFCVTACNTTRGVGEDVSAGGQAIQKRRNNLAERHS